MLQDKLINELRNFVRDFNGTCYGDSSDEKFRNKTNRNIEAWLEICKNANPNKELGEGLKEYYKRILQMCINNLTV